MTRWHAQELKGSKLNRLYSNPRQQSWIFSNKIEPYSQEEIEKDFFQIKENKISNFAFLLAHYHNWAASFYEALRR